MLKRFFLFVTIIIVNIVFAEENHNDKLYSVNYEGESIFFLSHDVPGQDASSRAEKANKLLAHAIEDKTKFEGPLVEIKRERRGLAAIYVRGQFVTSIYPNDAKAANVGSFEQFIDKTKADLATLVDKELKRKKWQSIAFKFFLTIILIFLCIFLLRQIHYGFDKLEEYLVKRQYEGGNVIIFGMPLLKGNTYAGLLALMIGLARWISYVGSVVIIAITILSQYKITRQFLQSLGSLILSDLVSALQKLSSAIPGFLLAFIILLFLHIGLHSYNLILESIRTKKLKVKSISEHRMPIFRSFVPALMLIIFLPLACAAFFQTFNNPTNWFLIGTSLVASLGALPIFATWLSGSFLLWRQEIKPGDWVCVANREGEVTSIDSIFLHIVPMEGGVIVIPMLKVFLMGIKKASSIPKKTFNFSISKSSNIKDNILCIKNSLQEIETNIDIRPLNIGANEIELELSYPAGKNIKEKDLLYSLMGLAQNNIDICYKGN